MPVACISCGSGLSPRARFCDQCGSPVTSAAPAGDSAVRKVVTVLFADLVGSTSFGERVDAESARETMAEYHEMATEAVESAGGSVAKFIGDGVMALFGAPETAEDDADRAVVAGLALQRGFGPIRERVERRHGAELGLRVGINTGEIVLADGDADLVGDAINTAARLEAACTPGNVLVGEETWRLTRSHVRYEVLGEVDVKGKDEPVATFQVADEAVVDDDQATPFVGRVDELARLREAFEGAVENRSACLATVIGSPGVGKTRIAREFCDSLGDGVSVAVLRCERAGTATFAPIADLLRTITTIDDDSDADHARAVLRELVADLDDADRVADLLASFIGSAPARSTEEAFLAVRRLVEATGRQQPLVVVVDDIQWAEPLFLDLLEHLAEWVSDAPAFIIGLARPELRELRPSLAEESRALAASIGLEGLDAAATAELAARLLGAESLPSELVARLPASTEGNPLFVRELMRMLVDDGVVEETGGGWQLTIDAEAVEVPPTIQSLLAARLDRMPADERRLVELASVVGPEFALGAVGAISESGAADLRLALERLRRRELVESTGMYWGDEPIYRFHHVLIRDAAYRRLLKRARADLHLRVGEWTERTTAELPGEHEVVIAHHFELTHEYHRQLDDVDEAMAAIGRRAAELLGTAAERALERDDLPAASSLAGRALARLDDGDPMIPAMLVVAAEALLALGDVGRGRAVVERLAEVVGDDQGLAPWAEAFVAQLTMLTEPDRLHDAEEHADRAATRLAELGDEAGVAKARLVRAGALARLGQIGQCEAELDQALTAARSAGDRRRVAAVLGAAPVAALWGPSPVPRAGGRCLDVIRLLRITTGSPAVEATSVRCQAVLEALRGRFETARTMLADSRATVEELGLRHALNETDLYGGIIELLAGDAEAAEGPLRAAYQGLGRLGIGADAGQAAAYLARALLQLGRVDEAELLAAQSAELAGENPQTAVAARTAQAEILAAQGRFDEAVSVARDAVARAEGTDIIVDHAAASAVLAQVSGLAGDAATADRAARAAAGLYEQKAATVSTLARAPVDEARVAAPGDEHVPWNEADRLTRCFIGSFTAGAREEWLPMLSPDQVTTDRRPLVGVDRAGADEVAAAYPRDQESGALSSAVETVAVRGESLALVRWKAASTHGREWDAFHLTRWTADGLNDLNVIFPSDQLHEAMAELDRLHRDVGGDEHVPWNDADRWARQLFEAVTARRTDDVRAQLEEDCEVHEREPGLQAVHIGRDAVMAALSPGLFPEEATVVADVETIATRADHLAVHRVAIHVSDEPDGATLEALHLSRWNQHGRSEFAASYAVDDLDEAIEELDRLHLNSIDASSTEAPSAEHEPWNEADRRSRLFYEKWLRGGVDAVLDDLDDSIVFRERQPYAQIAHVGREATSDSSSHVVTGAPAALDVETVATRGDHLALMRLRIHPRDDADGWLLEMLYVERWNERGTVDHSVGFASEQLADAVAELERLYQEELGDSFEGWQFDEIRRGMRLLAAGDVEGFLGLHHPSFVMRDHRQLGWPDLDVDGYRERLESIMAIEGDVLVFQEQILRLDHTTSVCAPQRIVFTAPDGTQHISRSVMVMIMDPYTGLITQMEQFDEDEADEAAARFDELMAERGAVLHNEASLRVSFVNSWLRRGDDELVTGALADGAEFLDERGEPFELTAVERREVIAVREDRLALVHVSGPGHAFQVEEIDRRGRLASVRRFATDNLAAAVESLERRWLQVGGDDLPEVLRTATKARLAMIADDRAAIADLFAPDYRSIDRRPLGLTLDRDEESAYIRGDGGVPVLGEVVRCDGRSGLSTFAIWNVDADGAAFIGTESLLLETSRAGRLTRIEAFDRDDLETALQRFDELTAAASAEPDHWNEADRLMRAFFDRMMDPSRDDWPALVAADFVEDDRRAVVGGGISSRDEYVRLWSGEQAAPGYDLTLETVATRADRLVLYRLTMLNDGVMTEFLQIDRWNDDGFMDRQVRLDPDALDGAMAELNRLWSEWLSERQQVVARLGGRLGEAWVAPSSHPFDDLLTDDFELVDGRTLGMGSLDRAGFEAALRGREADGTTGVPVPSRVRFVSDDVMVFRANNVGHAPESGVDWEEIACNVLVVEGERITRLEMFDEDQWDDAIARANHLVGADVPGGPEHAASRRAHNAASRPGTQRLDR